MPENVPKICEKIAKKKKIWIVIRGLVYTMNNSNTFLMAKAYLKVFCLKSAYDLCHNKIKEPSIIVH